ncbi:hypothetical protein EJ04DRAFT_555489 [Polyplosphaeria fusca]|uniref:F-box domain-containing protein n=1 Tax=Polyplosphaeria fusca TaxID=682080 RepID=A0A9P4QPJ5_9PLEO|nr:hypothetical protein EJ04DRAFT_555489 [Polyplosphaeria fusca]
MPAVLPDLPAELIGEIASHLVTGQHRGYPGRQLCNLRRVSRVFSKATSHVFIRATFSERVVDICSGDLQRLIQVKSNPAYADAIQSLRFERRDATSLAVLSTLHSAAGDTTGGSMCLLDLPDLIHIQLAGLFQMLRNLRTLTIFTPLLYSHVASRSHYGHVHGRLNDGNMCSILLAAAGASSTRIETMSVCGTSDQDFGLSYAQLASLVDGDLLTLRVDKRPLSGFRNLRSLRLTLAIGNGSNPQIWTELLTSLLKQMPDLCTLHVSYQQYHSAWSGPILDTLERFRLSNLSAIGLANMYSPTEQLTRLLTTYQTTLTHLSLDNYCLTEGKGWKAVLTKVRGLDKGLSRLFLDRLSEQDRSVQLRPVIHVSLREKYTVRIDETESMTDALQDVLSTMQLVKGYIDGMQPLQSPL